MIECCICKKGPAQGVSVVYRINAKGVPGLYACAEHVKMTDAPPIDPIVEDLVEDLMDALKED